MTKTTSSDSTKSTSTKKADAAAENAAAPVEEKAPKVTESVVEKPAKDKPAPLKPEPAAVLPDPEQNRYYNQLAATSGGLMLGLLALMTFLLTVGYSRPHANFSAALYASIGLLGANLVMPVVAELFRGTKGIKAVRIVQQVLFVASIVAIVCLALAVANFFFALPAAAGGGAAQ